MTRTFYVTTPIYYVNDRPHIGHMYTTVVADVIARYRRMMGDDVRFVTGTDEHGQKMERSAATRGIREIDLADDVVRNYQELYSRLEITNSDFIRTTQPRHWRAVEEIFARIQKNGDIYLSSYEGWYCTGCEAFYPENQVKEGRCEVGHPVERMKEESYFFRLSAYGARLLDLYERSEKAGKPFVRPRTRLNEVRSFVAGGLNDLSISRKTVRWGIPVPGDPEHVVYVWLDALTNYISALGFGSQDTSLFDRFWSHTDDATVVHLIGKDILRFHAVYWPAFLMSAGLPLPTTVQTHGWWLQDATKMSKSFGNVVRPGPMIDVFGPDPIRYFLLREMSFGADGTYSHQALIERLNGDLANGLGNLVSRVVALIERQTDGRIPDREPVPTGAAEHWTAMNEGLAAEARTAYEAYLRCFDDDNFSGGLGAIFQFVAAVNRFLVQAKPWTLDPASDRARPELRATLRCAAESLRTIAIWVAPVMPAASREILRQLGLPAELPSGALMNWRWDEIPGNTPIVRGGSLFPRVDRADTLARLQALSKEMDLVDEIKKAPSGSGHQHSPAQPPADAERLSQPSPGQTPGVSAVPGAGDPSGASGAPQGTHPGAVGPPAAEQSGAAAAPETIDIDQFMKIQLRTARIESAERIPKADKLLRLVVDLGGEKRQIVAGIATTYAPEALVGKTIVIVANLKPAKLRGVESQGMLLAADAGAGPLVVTFESDVPPGTRVR